MSEGDSKASTPPPQSIHTRMSMSPKVHSPYEEMFRKFTEDHKIHCRAVQVDVPKVRRPPKQYMTGSKYEGSWDILGMSGPDAIYTFPNGVIYEGNFDDGRRDGLGEMRYPTGEIMKGRFVKGRMVERTLTFADGLEYNDCDWMYCLMPDRRFTLEYDKGVMPAGKSYMTADLPTREIPTGYYDTGDGFYDPKTKMVYKAHDISALLRAPTSREQKWIENNCRYAPVEQMGPRRDLYEDWLEPDTDPDPPPLPAAITRATAWMFESNRSMMSYDSNESDIESISDFSKWLERNEKRASKYSMKGEPVKEQKSNEATEKKSETEYLLKSRMAVEKSTFNNRFRSPSAVSNPTTPQNQQ